MRVLHFSDVHVDVPLGQIPLGEWPGKRLLGGANLLLRRKKHFALAREKLAALAKFRAEQGAELVICTGDYTALGTAPELRAARAAIEPLTRAPLGFVTVPGNHDLYLPDGVRDGRFEQSFGDLLTTDLPEYRGSDGWPLVRLVDRDVAVVAVNSARPNPAPWKSSGRIPDAQLATLVRVLDDERVSSRFVFVITHYAPRLAHGGPDGKLHGLDNADAFLDACKHVARGAILHGHVHRCFHLVVPELKAHIFNAGSTTQEHREGGWLFDISATAALAARLSWSAAGWALGERESFG